MKISYHLPETTLDNSALVEIRKDWTEEKIFSKTGIKSRHIAGESEGVLDLAFAACEKLFANGVTLNLFGLNFGNVMDMGAHFACLSMVVSIILCVVVSLITSRSKQTSEDYTRFYDAIEVK